MKDREVFRNARIKMGYFDTIDEFVEWYNLKRPHMSPQSGGFRDLIKHFRESSHLKEYWVIAGGGSMAGNNFGKSQGHNKTEMFINFLIQKFKDLRCYE